MWPRYLEMMLGAWLIATPWIFERPNEAFLLNDLVCGILVIVLALLSFWHPTRWAHIGTGLVALWLAGSAWLWIPRPGPPAAQNDITVGILLITFFLLPNHASVPPEPWRRPQHE